MVLIDHESRLDSAKNPTVVLIKDWEITYESSPTENSKWFPFDSDTRAALAQYEGPLWLKRPLPELEWNNPYLFFSLMRHFEVFLDGERIYSFNMDQRYPRLIPHRMLHPVNVEPGLTGKQLMIHAIWSKDSLTSHDLALAGELGQFLYLCIISELGYLLTAFTSLLAGIVSLCLYIIRRERLYGWFTLFCIGVGLALLLTCRTMQWFVNMTEAYYWGHLLWPLVIWSCAGFFANALFINRMIMIRRIHRALGASALSIAVIAIVAPIFYSRSAIMLDAAMAIGGFAIVTVFLIIHIVKAGNGLLRAGGDKETDMERRWLQRGYWTFTIGAVISQFAFLFPEFLSKLLLSNPYWYRVIEGLIPNVLLLFILCMIMVVVGRVMRIYRESERNSAELLNKNKELEQFHHNLESLVEIRTSELELANRTLAVTMREKAETLAEMSVLEERSRIAYEMHDVVGHTLTAVIVQLEATKRNAILESELPLDKLAMISDLVRKGLDDIRKAVRLMKTDEDPSLPLEAALRELIQYTVDTMEIAVESDISLQPGMSLGRMTDGILYHALQEGLTNGIRHGGSRRFQFKLYCEDDNLFFRLTNDGEPFSSAQPGFGLSSMMERVELLGGTVTFRDSESKAGEPEGCQLDIVIPLS